MMDLSSENARLRDQLDVKDAEIAQLRRLIADQETMFPPEWDLTHIQARMVRFLMKRQAATREQLHTYLYGDREDGGPGLENVRVHICLLRKKLRPLGISVGWNHDGGYFLDDETKNRIRLCHSQ
ncbi:DNA-binding response OmpR family regulator [Labrenzia sp. EL_126]|nr:DNA-binding response OmpR family regulator [Labrenzia sp. EL_126]